MRSTFAAALTLLVTLPATAAAQRQRLSMDPGWRFELGDPAGAEAPGFDDRAWRRLDLPHDWSIEGAPDQKAPAGGRGGYYPTGVGWYRKAFRMPAAARGRLAWLEFDGVYMNSDVWINGFHLGHRPYGYSTFFYDVSAHLVPGVNVVAVRVDNSRQPSSRWYTGSGIYRHTWLILANSIHIGTWGVYVTTPRADSAGASVTVRTHLENATAARSPGVLRSTVLDPDGREVARSETTFTVGGGGNQDAGQSLTVPTPRLWSPETPALYSLRSELVVRGRVIDAVVTPFGIRTAVFDKDRGFVLNGRTVKLRGVNLHQDGGAVGVAVPEAIWAYRLGLLKAAGVNAIRTSHNPPAPEFLDLCDRLGFLVMAEAFDEWTYGKVPEGYHQYFAQWGARDAADFVRRDRNHPSIVLWSAGNEIGEQTTTAGVQVLKDLVDVFHREDPTRPVTTGNDQIDADGHPALTAFLEAEDVVGYNYVDRWHERRELFAEQDRHDHPDWKMVGTESGNIFESFDERPSLGPDSTVARANYTSGMIQAERLWKWVTLHDYFSGDFMWTGVDYLGEAFWPFKGFPSGMLDITGHPKDSYYLYQSLWTDQPVLHLLPHWTWPGREGQTVPVLVYTNCNAVELFLNGRSLGEKRKEFPAQGTSGGWNSYAQPVVAATTSDLHFEWDVPYRPGVLQAVGKKRDGTVACHDEIRTTGAPAAVRLDAVQDTITTAPGDVALVRFSIVDSAGGVVPTANPMVQVTVSGGTLVALDNADLQSHEPYRTDHRAAFNGRGLAIIRPSGPGPMTVTATSPGLGAGHLTVVARPGVAPVAVPAAR
ncbi:MAG TPA: glycoside hydrolase family 2 TIM barrel-domain containing protein [Acidimicrobiales bacterium]|nr:glycoside hydrolase family 2 TIM barrel-domain containing protein [Acidimicrobiales bacterium]